MIPLRDENPHSGFPFITILIIALNVTIFIYQLFIGPLGYEQYVYAYGLIPVRLTGDTLVPGVEGVVAPVTVMTSIFMHGGFGHLLGNMWFLWIFGDNIEYVMGHRRFVIFYLLAGVLASMVHVAVYPDSPLPLVGASGAIAGILGAYFLLFPRHRILTLIPIGIFFTTVRIPAAFFLGFWFLLQILYSMLGGQVAWWAHIGGFIAGMLMIYFFVKTKRRR